MLFRSSIYQCNNKFDKNKDVCQTPHLREDEIKEKFIEAHNLTMKDKNRNKKDLKEVINLLIDTTEIEKEINKINEELVVVVELATKAIKENSKSDDSNETKYQNLVDRHESLSLKLNRLTKEKTDKENKATKLKSFLSVMNKSDDKLSEWNEDVWMLMVENGIVNRDKSIMFKYNGS